MEGRDRTRTLLDVLMALSTLAGAGCGVLLVVDGAARPHVVGFGLLLVAMVVCWVLLRRRGSGPPLRQVRAAAVVFVGLGVAAPYAGDGPLTIPLFVMSLLVAASAFGPRTATVLVLVELAGQVVALVLVQAELVGGLLQLVATAFVSTFGLALAWLTAEHERQRREIGQLLLQVQRGARAEAELMLADERTRAARDLHDGLGHRLTVITMALQFAERMFDRRPDQAREQVGRARAEAGEALTTMRRWVRALSPVRTEGADLPSTLDAIATSFRSTGLVVDVRTRLADGPEPGPPVVLLCYRVVQEGLTNALRHAAATRVEVDVRVDDAALEVRVTDDGRPPGPATPEASAGFGLHSLRDRAGQLGGTVETRRTEAGWSLVARVPLAVTGARPAGVAS